MKKAARKASAKKASRPPRSKAKVASRSPQNSKKAARTAASEKRAVQRKFAPRPEAPAAAEVAGKLTFNHAMIYVKDVERAISFYRDLMGFKMIEDFRYEGKSVYARLRAPGGDGTIALHLAGPGASLASEGVRLYFEVGELDDFCQKLMRKGFYITQLPRMMPWGWRHAYLNDPDGHEISLYWAGENRFKKTVMQAARGVAKS
jgi:catechol 2,3-dioxygenase-like lactoylglutathione lyase family enzyme